MENTRKKQFKMPHLFWIMMGLLLLTSLLTYMIPAGQFMTDPETGQIMGDQFQFLGGHTPINPVQMMMKLLTGLADAASVEWVVMVCGASVAVVMETGAFDDFVDWAAYKFNGKDDTILVAIMYVLMVYLGIFGGSDALVAIVPIGVMFAKKLKLDPICAIGVTTYATLIGYGLSPVKANVPQMLMGVQIYGTFFTMFISANAFMLVGMFFLLRYVKLIRKDPSRSLMYSEGWRPETTEISEEEKEKLASKVTISWRTVLILALYIGQYFILVSYPLLTGDTSKIFPMMVALGIVITVVCGFLGGFSFDKVGEEFGKGLANVAFIAFVIGLARAMSNIMSDGNILHSIVYYLTLPLMNLPHAISTVGTSMVVSFINLFVPSNTSKAAILIPIIRPITEVLNIKPELAVQAFQYGNGITNLISPCLGWMVGSCVSAGVPFTKWVRWVLPKVCCFLVMAWFVLFCLTQFGWTPF